MAGYDYRPEDEPWPLPAYKNDAFLKGPYGRPLRIMSEFLEPSARFRHFDINNTVVFFGSSRARLETDPGPTSMTPFYEMAAALAERVAVWSKTITPSRKKFYVCSGGGPGIMEAANLGAERAGERSIGLNIRLPHEQAPNPYQSEELSFEFHYFFMRKFWFFYLAKALVVFPGGYGTVDELFELLTLVQTRKTKKTIPIVVMGKEFWNDVVDFDALLKWGTISEEDLNLFYMTDDVDEAFAYLKKNLTRLYL